MDMLRNDKNNIFLRWGFWIVIFFVIAIPIITIGDNLGLYYDSVLPDYAATQLLDNQEYQVKYFVAWPILTQYYHGCLSMYVSAFITMLVGSTSIIQHRLINAGIIVICFYLINRIFQSNGIRSSIRYGLIICFAFMPSMLGFCLTQYYIELPGVALSLFALLLLVESEKLSNFKIWISFVILGISFYSYFNFLFLFPGFLIIVLLFKKERILDKFILACLGMIPGSSLYVLGLVKKNLSQEIFPIVFFLFLIFLFLFEIVIYQLVLKQKAKLCLVIYGIVIFATIMGCILFKENLFNIVQTTNLIGANATLLERLKLLWRNIYYALSGVSSEQLIFGYQVTVYEGIIFWIGISCTFVYGLLMCKKSFRRVTNAYKYLLIVLLYLLCCIPLVSRMQTQHFVPLCFFILITCTIEIFDIVRYMTAKLSLNFRISTFIMVISIITITLFCTRDRYLVIDEIFETGGNGYYTSQINKLANQALKKFENGKKEIYLFPEWGFMSGFNYITNNNIPFTTNASEKNIDNLLSKGYDVEIIYWDDQATDKYMELLENIGAHDVSQYEYIGNEGTVDFYRLEIKKLLSE